SRFDQRRQIFLVHDGGASSIPGSPGRPAANSCPSTALSGRCPSKKPGKGRNPVSRYVEEGELNRAGLALGIRSNRHSLQEEPKPVSYLLPHGWKHLFVDDSVIGWPNPLQQIVCDRDSDRDRRRHRVANKAFPGLGSLSVFLYRFSVLTLWINSERLLCILEGVLPSAFEQGRLGQLK